MPYNVEHTGASAASVQPALFAGDCAATGYEAEILFDAKVFIPFGITDIEVIPTSVKE